MQMLRGTGLGLPGKELGLLFPTSGYVPSQHKGSFAFSFTIHAVADLNFPK